MKGDDKIIRAAVEDWESSSLSCPLGTRKVTSTRQSIGPRGSFWSILFSLEIVQLSALASLYT